MVALEKLLNSINEELSNNSMIDIALVSKDHYIIRKLDCDDDPFTITFYNKLKGINNLNQYESPDNLLNDLINFVDFTTIESITSVSDSNDIKLMYENDELSIREILTAISSQLDSINNSMMQYINPVEPDTHKLDEISSEVSSIGSNIAYLLSRV